LEEIDREFCIDNYSSVSTVIERTKQKAITDRKFRKRIENLKLHLMVSQEQTCPHSQAISKTDGGANIMERFNVICPDHYPMKCNLSKADKDYILTHEAYKAFFIFQYRGQDEWLEPAVERYFSERTWRLFNASKESGTGTKFCNICRYALGADFGIVSLTPLNHNVFQEVGLMQGFQKPLLYLLNPKRKDKLPFDIDDQIYIRHTDQESLESGLDSKMRLLLEKVRLASGFETEQKNVLRDKITNLTPEAKELLKKLVLQGRLRFRVDENDDFTSWVKNSLKMNPELVKELKEERFIVDETQSGGTRTITIRMLNEPWREYLEELIWE
jgi:hypothetical protein